MNSDSEFPPGSYCTKCGNALGVSDVFCAQCGIRREQRVTPNAEATSTVPAEGRAQIEDTTRVDSRLTTSVWVIAVGLSLVMFKLGMFDDQIRLVTGSLSSLSIALGAILAALGLSTFLLFKRRQVSTRSWKSPTNPRFREGNGSTPSESVYSTRSMSDAASIDSSSAETSKSEDVDVTKSDRAAGDDGKWFYVGDRARIGPVEEQEILNLMQSGQILRQTLLWQTGTADWKRAESTYLWSRRASSNAPPALPGSHVDNALAWVIAAVPLVGALLEHWLSQSYRDVSLTQAFLIYAAINTALIVVDAKKIEKSGHNPENIRVWIWFWLVPVYLYKRARALGHSPSYFWGWVAAFLISILISGPALEYLGSGVELSVRQSTDNLLTVTNIGNNPITIKEIRVNGRKEEACLERPNRTLATGQIHTMINLAVMFGPLGPCGKIVKILVRTDHGDREYSFEP